MLLFVQGHRERQSSCFALIFWCEFITLSLYLNLHSADECRLFRYSIRLVREVVSHTIRRLMVSVLCNGMAHTVFVIIHCSGAATQEMKYGFTSKGIVSQMCFWMTPSEPSTVQANDGPGEILTPVKAGQTSDPDADVSMPGTYLLEESLLDQPWVWVPTLALCTMRIRLLHPIQPI